MVPDGWGLVYFRGCRLVAVPEWVYLELELALVEERLMRELSKLEIPYD